MFDGCCLHENWIKTEMKKVFWIFYIFEKSNRNYGAKLHKYTAEKKNSPTTDFYSHLKTLSCQPWFEIN